MIVAVAVDSGRVRVMPLQETSSPTTARKNRCGLRYFLTWELSPEAQRERHGSQVT